MGIPCDTDQYVLNTMYSFTFREAIPRERTEYTASDHLLKRMRTKGRFVTEQIVRELISDGTLTGNRPGKGGWIFVDEYDGIEMKLVCDIGADLEARIVTGFSNVIDKECAIQSDRWGIEKIRQVNFRKLLSQSGNRVSKKEMKEIRCTTPINIKRHRIIVESSWNYAKCIDCEMESRSKSELSGTPCNHNHNH